MVCDLVYIFKIYDVGFELVLIVVSYLLNLYKEVFCIGTR